MNDTITVCGIIATEPRHLVTDTGIAITSMRLASPSRRWDRATSTWTNGATNWYSVTAFRTLAANVYKSVKKGDRIVVTGRVRIRTWERDGRGGTSVEIDAEGLGHDLAWGISNWIRVPRHASESTAAPGGTPTVDPRTGEVRGADADERHTADEAHLGDDHDHDHDHDGHTHVGDADLHLAAAHEDADAPVGGLGVSGYEDAEPPATDDRADGEPAAA
ncbi:single-stranded DNA-binding protein [Curtobacterium sp. MCBA15_008]|uniref:single-stranded DNA-binding protein n=1 Tax=Curtobacterium sp. MCBA15_008 TaxID=1898736 RepID=UPI0008DD991C|nr:single-stranded DNA-binding protein [Curtobacterium sp. MCBA15_008]OII05286.1 hypothetical protein BIU96_06400 [Curtobacterium sp. MCBA15_008]